MRTILLLVTIAFFSENANAESGMNVLRRLYPDVSVAQLRETIRNSNNDLKFLRSLVAVYYDYFANEGATLPIMQATRTQGGWCMGDAHLENFGALLLDNGTAVFTINDLDDSGPCPLISDAMRSFVAARLLDYTDAEILALVHEYTDTLDKGTMNYSAPTQLLLSQATNDGRNPKKSHLSGDTLVRPTDLGNVQNLSNPVRTTLTTILRAVNSRITLLDGFSYTRSSGGSAGTTRYRLLANVPAEVSGGGKMVVELKQLRSPGIAPLATATIPATPARISRSLQITLGSGVSPIYRVVSINNHDFLMRPLWKGNQGVELSDYSREMRARIVKDEIQTLALIHKRSADNAAGYTRAVKGLTDAKWLEGINATSAYVRRIYQEVSN